VNSIQPTMMELAVTVTGWQGGNAILATVLSVIAVHFDRNPHQADGYRDHESVSVPGGPITALEEASYGHIGRPFRWQLATNLS
jgi:hypothetical protein